MSHQISSTLRRLSQKRNAEDLPLPKLRKKTNSNQTQGTTSTSTRTHHSSPALRQKTGDSGPHWNRSAPVHLIKNALRRQIRRRSHLRLGASPFPWASASVEWLRRESVSGLEWQTHAWILLVCLLVDRFSECRASCLEIDQPP